jgi:RNA polymerase sigma factor (sigma-70 family)
MTGSELLNHPFATQLINRLAKQLSRRPGFRRDERDDLAQELAIHLWVAAEQYDPQRGRPEAFITTVLRTWCAMEVRRRRAIRRQALGKLQSLDVPLQPGNPCSPSFASGLSETDGARRQGTVFRRVIDAIHDQDELAAIFAAITAEERSLLEDVERFGVSGAGQRRGISRHAARRLVLKIAQRCKIAAHPARKRITNR